MIVFFLFCLNFECLSLRVAAPTPGTLLAFFGGNLIPVDSLEKAFEEEIGVPVTSLQPSDSRLATSTKTETEHPVKQLIRLADYLERKSYLVALDKELDIDIPPELRDTKSYNATLGHKVNHWPLPNSFIGTGPPFTELLLSCILLLLLNQILVVVIISAVIVAPVVINKQLLRVGDPSSFWESSSYC